MKLEDYAAKVGKQPSDIREYLYQQGHKVASELSDEHISTLDQYFNHSNSDIQKALEPTSNNGQVSQGGLELSSAVQQLRGVSNVRVHPIFIELIRQGYTEIQISEALGAAVEDELIEAYYRGMDTAYKRRQEESKSFRQQQWQELSTVYPFIEKISALKEYYGMS
ncbi:hypothetical protein [Fischerella sp. PCC 9605]|uniref:hypothetical protein n=1 Tax=Fischerella sp. PCC 9605 TaxID=1173024 RepID=UPI00047AE95C|nr:hypothetical protein [Fischerella sp. PCC 9605]